MEAVASLPSLQDQTFLCCLLIFVLLLMMTTAILFFLQETLLLRESSLQLSYVLFQILWAPITMIFRLPSDASEMHGAYLNIGNGENSWMKCFKSPWKRQIMFVLVVMGFERAAFISLSLCWCYVVWQFPHLCRELLVHHRTDSATPTCQVLCMKAAACIAFLGALAYISSYGTAAEVCGCLAFLVLTDSHFQTTVASVCGQTRLQRLEGLDEDYFLGAIMAVDISLCLVLMLLSLYRTCYLLTLVAMVNVVLGVLGLWHRVWLPLQGKLSRMRGLRLATRQELLRHNDVCPVCLTPMASARVTVCGHIFHGCCLRHSLDVSPRCPVCKTTINQPG